jgi:chromosome partitioning protein
VRIRFFGALDLDPQASLVSWGERRKAASTPNKLVIEPFEGERLPLLHAILEGLAEAGFTIAVFDTAANSASARLVAPAADICLLPTRPTRLDVDVAAATFRAACLAERKAALLLNQCPPTYPSSRTRQAEQALTRFGVLATPTLCARMDFQDAIAIGLGVTEYACEGKAAQEIEALWGWIRAQLESTPSETLSINDKLGRSPLNPRSSATQRSLLFNRQAHPRLSTRGWRTLTP